MSDIPGQGMSDNPPMSDIRTRIAAVADAHTAMGYDSDYGPNDAWVCNCGWTWTAGGTHGEHLADAVIAELDMTARCASGCRLQQIAKRLDDVLRPGMAGRFHPEHLGME